jgi:NAD(P)-dependent dehydrogenase (short-subunit alcohol dehydrogenase family)
MKSFLNNFNFKNKKVFLIGGNGLIGSKIFMSLNQLGAKITIFDISNKNLKKFKNYNFVDFDLTDENILDLKFKTYLKKNCPDILINCSYPKTTNWSKNNFSEIKYNDYKKNIDLHLNSYAWIAKLTANEMKRKKIKGNIVFLSSIYGLVGQNLNVYKNTKLKENMSYAIIKGGINTLTKSMSSYYGNYGIRVNALCAGGVSDNQPKSFIKNYNNLVPLKRLASPQEIANSTVFLCSDAASYITGSLLLVDGGWTSI